MIYYNEVNVGDMLINTFMIGARQLVIGKSMMECNSSLPTEFFLVFMYSNGTLCTHFYHVWEKIPKSIQVIKCSFV